MATVETTSRPAAKQPTATPPAAKSETRNLLPIMIGIMLGVLLGALDQTIVGPAMPKIIGELNGFDRYVWPTIAYMLTSTIVVPISGKLGDLYGRKWFFVGGIVVFLIGSALSGLSGSMDQLILFRGFQGLGGGIMFSNAFAIIGDLVPPAERGRWQGLFGGTWGLASVFGPTVGGFLTDNLNWRWVFYVNIPVGFIALAVLFFTLPNVRRDSKTKPTIDWFGAILLAAGLTPLLVALSLGGSSGWAWDSAQTIGMLIGGVVLLVGFVLVEARAKEPIIPLDLFKSSIFNLSVLTVFLTGLGMFGAISFIPLFIQAVQGDSASNSGQALTPMMIMLVISSIITGQVLSKTGKYRILGVIGMVLLTGGMFLLSTMNIDAARWQTIVYMMVMGLGLGVAMPLYTLVVQNAFPANKMGVVTSAVTFFRSIGGTIGVAILGAVVTNRFQGEFGPNLQAADPQVAGQLPAALVSAINPQVLVSADALNAVKQNIIAAGTPAAVADRIVTDILLAGKEALSVATTEAFFIGAVILLVAIVATVFIKEIPLRGGAPAGAAMAEGGFVESAADVAVDESNLVIGDEDAARDLVGAGTAGDSKHSGLNGRS